MTIAYFDCFSGISGDMTLGALLDCGAERSVLDAAVEALRLGDEVTIDVRHETRGHAGGTRVIVGVDDRVERTVPALREVVEASDAPHGVKKRALEAVNRLARAEAAVHGVPEEKAHLHELGGADTLVDIVGAFWLLDSLEVGRVYSSALPISRPGPATLKILEGTGAELRPGDESRELVTPTGAAILAAAATFTRPAMSLRRVGYGVGTHPSPGNLLAVWIGDEIATDRGVTMIETNLDDMAPNLIAALCEDLMAGGALDVSITPVLMKKGRPGQLLSIMATPDLSARLTEHLLRHSTTLGVRVTRAQRIIAERRVIEVQTTLGPVRVKVKELGGKAVDVAPEYEDCRRIARETGRDLRDVMRLASLVARNQLGLVSE